MHTSYGLLAIAQNLGNWAAKIMPNPPLPAKNSCINLMLMTEELSSLCQAEHNSQLDYIYSVLPDLNYEPPVFVNQPTDMF